MLARLEEREREITAQADAAKERIAELSAGVVTRAVDATVEGDPVRAVRRETAGDGEADRVLVVHDVDDPGAQVPAQTVVGAQV
ncbi:hypothetical protein AB0I98_18700 [Streptomyces sp. NPDC050211]|uniref:hypothetical protein n=1 Tax=Streptomyces sp. NPDC050211 TaxID=3154932 RepID=UPI0034429FDA